MFKTITPFLAKPRESKSLCGFVKFLFSFTFVLFFFFTTHVSAYATTYCVRTDGTAIKTNAIGPTSDTTKCMSQETFTSSTFSPLDVIYFSGLGADDYTNLTIPSSGTMDNLITYQGVTDGRGTGGYPKIVTSGLSINTNSKSFITVSGFDVEYDGSSASDIHVYVPGTVSYVTFSNLTLNGQGYGYGIYVGGSVSNITLSNITISNIGAYYSVWFPGAANSAITINNFTTSGGRGMLLENINGLTMTNVTSNITSSMSYSSLELRGGSGALIISGYSSTGSLARGLYISSGSYTTASIANATIDSTAYAAGIELNGISASSSINISYPTITNSSGGIYLTNLTSPSIQLLNGAIYNNGVGIVIDGVPGTIIRGFNPKNITNGGLHDNNLSGGSGSGITVLATTGNSNNMIVEDNWIYNNGYPYTTAPYNANHDGIDMHANCGNAIIRNNIIVNNGNAGVALVMDSYGEIYNNVIAYNGSNNGTPSNSTARGGFYNSGSGSWTLNNNIFMNNYPYDYNINNNILPPVTLSNNNIFFHDRDSNSLFYNASTATGYTITQWQSVFNQDLNSLNTNPLFLNASTAYSLPTDFQLQYTSPAINTGISLDLTTDFIGTAIPQGGIPDIGAYEFIDTTPPTIPETPSTTISNNSTTPTWNWTASTDSGIGLTNPAYTIQWSTDQIFTSITGTTTINTNSFTHSNPLTQGTWYFRVKSIDKFNNSSDYSSNGTVIINPTPTTIPTNPQSNTPNSSNNSSSSVMDCHDSSPFLISDLFQINTISNNAKLFFTPIDTNQFYVSFSTKPNAEDYGELITLAREGVQSHTIYLLKPNTTYYIKIRGQNGCATGNWSNIMAFTTPSSTKQKIFYKNSKLTVITNRIKSIVNNVSKIVPTKNTTNKTNTKISSPTVMPTVIAQTKVFPSPTPAVNSVEKKKTCILWWCF